MALPDNKSYNLIYWKGMRKDDVKVKEQLSMNEVNDFLNNSSDQYWEYLICEYNGKSADGNTSHYRVLNQGAYVFFKRMAFLFSLTVMGAIIAGILYQKFRHIH